MLHQTTSRARKDQGCIAAVVVIVAAYTVTACGRAEATIERAGTKEPAVAFETQPVDADPCGWVTREEVSAILRRPLRGVPVRVASAESVSPSATGSGCLYEIEPEAGQEPGMVTIELKTEAMEMQAGLGAASMGEFASAKGSWTTKWDWVSALPAGLFAARQGHIGMLIAINAMSLSPMDVEPLGAKVLSRVRDVPFAYAPTDPAAPGTGSDPCELITRAEAETVLGSLTVAPFRSRESTPFAHGAGKSCTYYTADHHVVVLTPTRSEGRMIFGMMRGIGGLTRPVTGEAAPTNSAGAWDDRTTGIAGRLYFLKGDRMLEMQYRTSALDESAALRLATIAMGRL